MELRQITYFVAVSEELSFSRAAERCFISQSAISHQITRLERDLAVKLFERTTRSVLPTESAARLLPLAKQMLSLESAIYAAARTPNQRIRLAANMSFATQSLSAISRVRADYPDTEIEFVIKSFRQRIAAVADGDCDVALIRGTVDQHGLGVEHLWTEDLMIATAAAHPLAALRDVSLVELSRYPLLLPPERDQLLLHNVIRAAFEEMMVVPSYGPPIPHDHTATLELINRPDAWTVLYAADRPSEGIAFLQEAGRRLRIPVSAVLRSDTRPSETMRALLAALRNR